jgi:hypothetical protein
MSEAVSKAVPIPAMRTLQIVGAVLFAISFACPVLPKVHYKGPVYLSAVFGYDCARFAVVFGIDELKDWHPRGLLLIMSDLINLLVPAYLVLTFFRRRKKLRTVLVYLTFACMIATWGWFLQAKTFPRYGHFAWMTGALLILLPQWMQDRKSEQRVA